jgi:hypothetical protein
MSDSSSVQLFYSEEDTWGESRVGSPLAAPTLAALRFTNESLNQTTETAISEEIRSDRQVADIIRTAVSAGGEVGLELSYGAYDTLLQGALYNNFTAALDDTQSYTLAIDSPATTGTLTASGSPGPFANVAVGQFIQISGSLLSPTNDGFYRVVAATPDVLTISPAPTAGETATLRVRGSHLSNGVTRKSFTLEKFFSDVNEYVAFAGMRVGTLGLTITPGSILNGSFSFEGKSAAASGATVGDGSPTAAPTNDVMNAVDNIDNILVDDAPPSTDICFTNIDFEIDNSLRAQPCIGQLENSGIGIGRTQISGTIEAYFVSRALYERYLNFTETSLSFRTVDTAGNSYYWDFPSVKFTAGEVVAEGNDQDVLVSLEFSARRDPTNGFMIGITRFAA